MPVGAFVPSELEYDYPRWTAPAIGSTDTGKAWAWNHAIGKYEPTTFLLRSAVSAYGLTLIDDADAATARTTLGLGTMATASVPGSTTQVIYNAAGVLTGDAGMTYDAVNDRLTVAGGLVTPGMQPASDSTTALQLLNAAGTAVVTVDTTNNQLLIGGNKIAYDTATSRPALKFTTYEAWIYITSTRHFRFFNSGFTSTLPSTVFSLDDPNKTLTFTGLGAAIISRTSSSATARFQIQNSSGVAIADWYSTPADNGQHFNNAASGGTPYTAFEIAGTAVLYSTANGASIGTAAASTAILDLAASTTTRASLRIRSGVAPTTPNAGDIWFDGTHFYGYTGSATVQLDN